MKFFKTRRRTIRRRLRLGPTVGRILAIATVALLAVASLTQATSRETILYEATKVREQQGELEQELNELRLLETRAKTLERITQSTVKDELVPMGDDVEYLTQDEAVAGATTSR